VSLPAADSRLRGMLLHWSVPLALVLSACGGAEEPKPAFVTLLGDIDPFELVATDLAPMICGREGTATILEVNGGGVALFDADGDADMDLLLVIPGAWPEAGVPGGGTNRLYRNDDGVLVDVTVGSGVDIDGWCNGVAVGDVDADGDRDLYLTRLGGNVLLRNLGGCRFEPVDDAAGAAGGADEWSTSAVFVDLDRDGDADLYVTNYLAFDPADPPMHGEDGLICTWQGQVVMCGPQGLPAQADRFFLNEGGRFREATAESGLSVTAGYGLGVIDGDWNDDGWPDLYVSNDSMANRLFLSRGDGTLRDAGTTSGAALSARGREQAGMGIASGDADGDGDEDLLVTNFALEPNAFYVNEGGGVFNDRSDPAGLGGPSRPMLGWGAAFLDADLDGVLDLLAANGHVYSQADVSGSGTTFAQPDMLWFGLGQGNFRRAPWAGDTPAVSRALATGDIDGDGLPDLVITHLAGAPTLLRGTADASRSLQVQVLGRPGNPDGVGTQLRLVDAEGEQHRRVRVSAGFQACSDPRPVFAYRGAATLEVVFPDGTRRTQDVRGPGLVQLEVPNE